MNTQTSSDLGQVVFRGPKPAPPIANWIAIAILLMGSVCVSYWTIPMIRDARSWRENFFLVLIAHGGPILAAFFVWLSMLDQIRGQLVFHEKGVSFSQGTKSVCLCFDELERVTFVEVPPKESAAGSALFGILIGNWARVGKAYGESKFHWHVVVKPIDAPVYSVKIPDSTTFQTLQSLVPNDKRVDEVA